MKSPYNTPALLSEAYRLAGKGSPGPDGASLSLSLLVIAEALTRIADSLDRPGRRSPRRNRPRREATPGG